MGSVDSGALSPSKQLHRLPNQKKDNPELSSGFWAEVESVPCFKELEHHRTGLDLYEHILLRQDARALCNFLPKASFDPDSTSGAWAMIKSWTTCKQASIYGKSLSRYSRSKEWQLVEMTLIEANGRCIPPWRTRPPPGWWKLQQKAMVKTTNPPKLVFPTVFGGRGHL